MKSNKDYVVYINGRLHFIKELIDKYPFIKISDKVRRGKKFVNYNQVALPLTDDVKQYIDDIINELKNAKTDEDLFKVTKEICG